MTMELKEPKRKRRVPPILLQSFPIPIGGISAISVGHWQVYYGRYLGDTVVVEDPNDMAALYNKGFFGKSSFSRDMAKLQKGAAKTPIIIRQRQWERRCKWAKKQQVMTSDLQHMFTQGYRENISEQVSRKPSKDQFDNSLKEPGKKDINVSEKTVADNGTVAIDETDKHNEETERTTTNTLADKSEMETQLVALESKDQIRKAVKSSAEKSYDIILLDSEEDETVSVVDETRKSRKIKTCKNENVAPTSNISPIKLTFTKEVDVASNDSEESNILNESEEKAEIIGVEESKKVLDAVDNDRSRSDHKRGRKVMDDDTVSQEKRRTSDEDKGDADLNKPESAGEKSHVSREDEVIVIDMEACSEEGVEGKVMQKQTEIETNGSADERNKEDASVEVSQPTVESDATEKSESKNEERTDLDRSQGSHTGINKDTEEAAVSDSSAKPVCELISSAKAEDSNTMEMNQVAHFAEPEDSSSANVSVTEKREESISDSEKTKSINSSADGTMHMEVENSDNITKDVDEHKTKANKDRIANGDEDLVLVLSDGDSDSEEFLKNVNPRLEKEMFVVRETLQLMPEEAFFLSFGLGCLHVLDMSGNILSLTQMWQVFRKSNTNFTSKYIAYHYFRSKGWVVKPGIKFGGDFLLYKQGPAFYHSSYVVIVETLDGTSWNLDDKESKPLSMSRLYGLIRLAESAGKELLLCQVIKPPDVTQKSMDSPSIISKFKVHEQLFRRWIPSEEREENDVSD